MKFLVILAILTTTVAYPATIRAELSVEPAGMKIIWKPLKNGFDGFQTYDSKEGNTVYIRATADICSHQRLPNSRSRIVNSSPFFA